MRAVLFILLLAACASSSITAERLIPDYKGVETRLLQDDLVQFEVEMTNALTDADVKAYAECAAAGYALIRGVGFAQHVRTQVSKESALWRGDAVYTISKRLPPGQKLDAEVVAAACKDKGIPTV